MNSITYICNYVLTYYESVKEFSNSDFILSLAKAITDDIPNVDFTTGNYDFYIDNFIYRIMEHRNSVSFSNYINVKNHVFLVVNYYKISNNLKLDNIDNIVKCITNEIMNTNSYEEIISGDIDEYIESLVFTINLPNIKEDDKIDADTMPVFDYIVNFLNKNSNAYSYDGDILTIAKDIMDDALSRNIDKSDILNHKYDKEMYLIIIGSSFNLRPSNALVGVVDYVRSLVNKYNRYMNLDNKENLMLDNALNISFRLVSKVPNVMEIYDGNYDEYIINEIKKSCMKKNSLVTNAKNSYDINPNSFSSNNRKIKGTALAAAVLSATIVFMAKNNTDEVKFDSYNYETIENEHDDEFADTLIHIEEQFSKNENVLEGTGQLCFKNAYDSVNCEKFHAMDTMFFLIQQSNVYDKTEIGSEIENYTCYARYVYDKLMKNGYDLSSKYLDAVNNYDRQVANYKLLNPYYTIDKKDRSTLNSMMKMYTKYCNDLENSLNKTVEGKKL